MANLLIFQRLIPVLSLRTLATSSRGLKKDYPWNDYLEKLPDPSDNYKYYTNPKILGHAGTARFILSFLKIYNDV